MQGLIARPLLVQWNFQIELKEKLVDFEGLFQQDELMEV
jgi:hypothetical protein